MDSGRSKVVKDWRGKSERNKVYRKCDERLLSVLDNAQFG